VFFTFISRIFIEGNVKVFDTDKKPHPPTPSPTERGRAGNNLLINNRKTLPKK